MTSPSKWQLRYSPWLGVVWGPIPVGLILLVIGVLTVLLMYYRE